MYPKPLKIPRTTDIAGQLVFLGTGTSHGVPMIGCDCETCTSTDPRNTRTRCSLMLGLPLGNLLIDTTPDLRMQMLRERLGVAHATLYTHSHADHLFGLDDLRIFPFYTGMPMPVYCEELVERRIRESFGYIFQPAPEGAPFGSVPQLEFRRIALEPFQVLGATVTPIRLWHAGLGVLGFRVGNIAYCTDTNRIPEESFALLEGLDVLILDALRPTPHISHFSLDQAIEAARRIGARRTLFTHMAHSLEHAATCAVLPAGMELAYDGLRVPLNVGA